MQQNIRIKSDREPTAHPFETLGQDKAEPLPEVAHAESVSTAPAQPKKRIFRSVDRGLKLVWAASYMQGDPGGMKRYVPAQGVQFVDWYLEIDDEPKNADTIKRLVEHPANAVNDGPRLFRELSPEALSDVITLPALKKMDKAELLAIAEKRGKKLAPDMSREAMILEIIE